MSRQAHHLWGADRDDKRGVRVHRSKLEKEDWSDIPAHRTSRRNAAAGDLHAASVSEACWGIFGADLVDDLTLNSELPTSVRHQFNKASRIEDAPRVYSWDELSDACSPSGVLHARQAISRGMRIRMASKFLGVPFIVTAELLDRFPKVSKDSMKAEVLRFKSGKKVASSLGRRVAEVIDEFADGRHKIAIDAKAKAYWESFFGPFGEEMVREVQKRVRADLAKAWFQKNAIDEKAAEYWSNYYGAYGKDWVSIVPKKISPSNAK